MSNAMYSQLLDLSGAAATLPHRPNKSTIWRWCRKGMEINGHRIYLPYKKIGRRIFIARDDLEEFIEALTEADRQGVHDAARREQEIAAAEERVVGPNK